MNRSNGDRARRRDETRTTIFRAYKNTRARSIDRRRRRARRRVSRRARTGGAREISPTHTRVVVGRGCLGSLEAFFDVKYGRGCRVLCVFDRSMCLRCGGGRDGYRVCLMCIRYMYSYIERYTSKRGIAFARTPFMWSIHPSSRSSADRRVDDERTRANARDRYRLVHSRLARRHGVASRRGIDRVARTTTARSNRGRGATPWGRARGRRGGRDVDARGDERWRAKERTR